MKTTYLKGIAYALTVLMLMQSCTVYHKVPVSIDEAIATENGVKVYTTNNETYKFKKLLKEDGNLCGIGHINGPNAKKFAEHIKEINTARSEVKILLPFEIKEVYTKNKAKSTMVMIIIATSPLWILGAAIGIAAIGGGPY